MIEVPLVVFADDWGRHPSSCQHLVRHLLDRCTVIWVNTIGTRPPRVDLSTVGRAVGKIRQWLHSFSPASVASNNPRVLHPIMWPSFRSAWSRRLNRWLLSKALTQTLRELSQPPVVLTTLPLVVDLIDRIPARRWVYYCVDDFSQWPGYDGETLGRLERELLHRVDEVVAVSEALQQRLQALGRPAHLLTHGIDADFWANPCANTDIAALQGLPRPLIVFWGLLDRRMDVAYVRQLADDLQAGTLVLIGPEDDADPQLFRLPRVHRLGKVPFESLPALAQQAAVLIMPYADLPATRAMQPLKLKEYLATGKPVVVRDLPANRCWADALDLADSPTRFSQLVQTRLQTGLPEEQRLARQRLAQESWSSKAAQLLAWLVASAPTACSIADQAKLSEPSALLSLE